MSTPTAHDRRDHPAAAAYRPVIWMFLAGLAAQFWLAGLGVLGGGTIDGHRGLGQLLIPIGLVLLLLSVFGRMGRAVIGGSAALLLLLVLQAVFAQATLAPVWLRSLHVFDAFVIAGLSLHLAWRVRTSPAPASGGDRVDPVPGSLAR